MRRYLTAVFCVLVAFAHAKALVLAGPVLYWGGASTSGVPAGGTGTWNTTTANWADDLLGTSYQAWGTGNSAAYFGSGGAGTYVVTLSNGGSSVPAVESLTFAVGGYTLSPTTAETLTLSGTPVVRVDQGAATIAADMAGLGLGLNKTGAGMLRLTGANFGLNGVVALSEGYLQASGNDYALGGGTLSLSGGVLALAGDAARAYNRDTSVTGSTLVLLDRGATGAGVTHTLGTLAIGSQTLNVFGTAYTNSGTAGLAFGAATLNGNPVFNVRNRAVGGSTLTSLTMGALTGTDRDITTTGNGNVIFSGDVATGAGKITVYEGTTTFSGAVTSTGAFTVYNGSAVLSGSAATLAGPDIRLLGGRLQLGAAIGENNVVRLTGTPAPTVTMGGGTLYLMQPGTLPANPVSETLGQLILKPGHSGMGMTGGSSGTHRLVFSELGSRDLGSTFSFLNSSNFPVQFSTTAPTLTGGIIGGWAVRGQEWATVSGTGVDVSGAAFDSTDINTLVGNNNIDQSLASSGVVLANTQTINSLRLVSSSTAANFLDLNRKTLTLTTGGLMTNFTAANHRVFVTNGTLTAGTTAGAELFLMLQGSNGNGGQQLGVGATIADNAAGAVNLVRGGEMLGGSVFLSGANTYTGKTVLGTSSQQGNGGIVYVMTERQFGATPATGTVVADKMILSNTFVRFSDNVPFSWAAERGITLGSNGGQINPGNYGRAVLSAPISGTGYFAFSASAGNVETTLSGANTFDGPMYAGGPNAATNFTSIGNIGDTTPNAMGCPSNAANGLIRQATPANNFAGDGNNMSWVYVGAGPAATDRSFEFNYSSNGSLGASGTGAFTVNGNVYLDPTGASQTFNLVGTGLGIINGNIIQTTSGDSVLRKNAGVGTWRLTGQNTYTGATSANAGVLEFTTVGNVGAGPSSLGAPTTGGPTGNGAILFGNSGILRFVGSTSQTSDRNLRISGGTYTQTGVEASGADGAVLTFTGGVSSNQTSGNWQFHFGGTGVGVQSGVIANGAGSTTNIYKYGSGTWTFNQSSVNTYTGSTNVSGGTLVLDYSNLATPTNLIGSASALNLGGGNLTLRGKNGAATSQTFGAVTLTGGTNSQIVLDANGATGLALTTGTWTRNNNSGATLAIVKNANTTLTTTAGTTLVNGLLPYATIDDGTSQITFATKDGSNNIVAYADYTAGLPTTGGTATQSYDLVGGQVQAGNVAFTALRIKPSAAGQSLEMGAFNLGTGSSQHAILFDGTANAYAINATTGLLGNNAQELIVHTVGSHPLTISAQFAMGATSNYMFTKAGAGTLILSGANTYNGQTNVNAGTLQAGSATAFSPNSVMNVGIGSTLALDGNSVTTGPLVGGGNVTNGADTDATLTFGNNSGSISNANATIGGGFTLPLQPYGVLSDGGDGKLHLNKIGSNLQVLSGPNTFTGSVTVNEGILAVPLLTDAGAAGPLGAGTGALTLGSPSRQGGVSFVGTHNASTNRAIALAAGGVGVLDVYNAVNNNQLPLALSGAQTLFGDTALFSGNIAGSGQLAKTGLGNVILSGTNAYTGRTNVVSGLLQFNTTASIGGSGPSIQVYKSGTVATGYAMNQAFLDRIDPASSGVVALGADTSNDLDMSGLPNVSLGAAVNFSLSGNLTPANNTYRLGGGLGALLIQKANVLSDASPTVANSLVVSPNNTHQATVVIADAQSYTGTTTVQGTIYPAASNAGLAYVVDSPATLILAGGSAGIAGTSGININSYGTLRIVASAGDAAADKLGSAPIAMNGGALEYRNDGSAFNFTQNIGAVNVNRGSNSIVMSATGGTAAVLTMGGLTRTAGTYSTVDFNAPNTSTAQIVVAGGATLGEWATYGGQSGFAELNGSNQIVKAAETATAEGPVSSFADGATNYTVPGGKNYGAASGTARTIRVTGGGSQSATTLNLGAADTLAVNALMAYSATNTPLVVGTNNGQGTVQPASGTDLYVHTGGTGSPVTIKSNIVLPSGGALVKSGNLNTTGNSLTLSGTNAFDKLVINAGYVVLGTAAALPASAAVTLNGGQLIPLAGSTFGNPITINADATVGGNNNSFTQTGDITLNNNAMMQIITQGTQTFSGAIGGTGGVYIGDVNNGQVVFGGSANNTYSGPTWIYGSPTGGNTSPGITLSKTDAVAIPGDVYLGWQTSSSGVGTSYPRNERLILGTAGSGNNQIADTAVLYFSGGALADAGSFELNTKSETIAGIHSMMTGDGLVQNLGSTTTSILTLAPQAGKTYDFSGTIRDGGSGKLALNLSGDPAGTQILSGPNTYTGNTVVTAGTLVAANTVGSATGTGSVALSGGTLASGATGSISGPVVGDYPAHVIAPGGLAGIGTLYLTNAATALTLNDFSTLDFDIVGADADLLAIAGQLAIVPVFGGNPSIAVHTSGMLSGNYTLATFDTSAVTPTSFGTLPSVPGYAWDITDTYIKLLSTGPAISVWNKAAGGSWTEAGNWTGGLPNAVDAVAELGIATTAPVTVNAGNVTVGAIKFTTTNAYAVHGTNSITMQTSAGNALIDLQQGGTTHTLDAPLVIASDTTIAGPATGTGSLIAGNITTDAGKTLTVGAHASVAADVIGGSGSTAVNGSLTADSIVQNTLTISAGGSVTIRETPGAAGGANANAVPEPGALALLIAAALTAAAWRRRVR